MPRRREVTIDGLQFAWERDGTPSAARMAERPRPMAYEVGRVLLTLEQAATGADERGADVREGALPAPSTVEVSQLAAISETEARAALRELLLTGCVARQRVKLGRQRDFARWAHGFHLAPAREERGPGRRARLTQLALIVEPSVPCGDLLDVLLRRNCLLPAQVVSPWEARRLLGRLGFELVVLDADAASPVGTGPLLEAMHAAGCGAMLWLTPRAAASTAGGYWRHPSATLSRPFTPQAFDAALSSIGIGSFDPLAHPREIEEIGV